MNDPTDHATVVDARSAIDREVDALELGFAKPVLIEHGRISCPLEGMPFTIMRILNAVNDRYAEKTDILRALVAVRPGVQLCDMGGDEGREGTESISEIPFLGAGFHLVLLYCQSVGATAMIKADLSDIYRNYIACLNKQDWPTLEQFVHDEVSYNGRRIGLSGYREMLERDFYEIPDLYFDIQLLISDPPYVASRLGFDCAPKGNFLGLPVNGKRVSFTENVFYEFRREKIWQVWSVIDKAAIEAQL